MKRLAAALAVAAVVVAAAMWWPRAPEERAPAPETQRVLAHADAPPSTPPAAPTESPAARKVAELRALSESVRNSTFVIAIRAAGLVCEDVIGVDQIELGAPAWRARCPDLRAYFVRVTDAGELAVEPALAHFDSVVPAIVAPPGNPPDLLQPREPQR
jgi:hypothetical protein